MNEKHSDALLNMQLGHDAFNNMNNGGGGGPGFDPFGGFKSPFEDMFKNADVRTIFWFSSDNSFAFVLENYYGSILDF